MIAANFSLVIVLAGSYRPLPTPFTTHAAASAFMPSAAHSYPFKSVNSPLLYDSEELSGGYTTLTDALLIGAEEPFVPPPPVPPPPPHVSF